MPNIVIMLTVEEAKEQIQSFNQRYYDNSNLVKSNAEARKRHNEAKEEAKSKEVADSCLAKYNNPTDLTKIIKLQRFFKQRILSEHPLPISHFNEDSSRNYPDGFLEFIGKDSGAKRSLNVTAVRELAEAVNRGDWDVIRYKNDGVTLQRRAISAAANGSISIEQCTTLLRYTSFLKGSNGEVSIYCLVNEKGEWTDYSLKTFIPLLKKFYNSIKLKTFNADLSDKEIEKFRIYLQAIPLSERFVFALKNISQENKEMIKKINAFSFWVNENEGETIYLSVGASDALYATKYPLDDLVHIKPKQGKITIRDIEEAKINDACFASCFTEDTQPTRPAKLHKYDISDKNEFVGLIHDDAHRHFTCATPKLIRKVLWYVANILRQQTGFEFSKEIWMFFDLATATPIKYRTNSLEENGKERMLCAIINNLASESGFTKSTYNYDYFLFLMHLIAIDMLKNKKIWADKHGLDIYECQTGDFGDACLFAVKNQTYIENSDITSALLKLYLFKETTLILLQSSELELSKLVDEAESSTNLNLGFKKSNKEDHGEKNRILFCLNDSPLKSHSCYKIKQHLIDITQQKKFHP